MKYGRRRQGAVGEEGRHFRESTVALVNCYACKVCVCGGGAGSVKGGRQMSLRSVESVMTSCGAVTSDGEGVWGTEERKETQGKVQQQKRQ